MSHQGPAPVRLLPTRKRLLSSGAVELEERDRGARSPEKVLITRRPPEPVFDTEDLQYLDRALEKFHGMTAKDCRGGSIRRFHDEAPGQFMVPRLLLPASGL